MTTRVKKTKTVKKPAAKGLARTARQLVEALEERGLFEQDEIARLAKALSDLEAEGTDAGAMGKVGTLHRRLVSCLSGAGAVPDSVRGKKLEALFEINRLVSRTAEPQECFDLLLHQIRKLIPYEGATLFLSDRR